MIVSHDIRLLSSRDIKLLSSHDFCIKLLYYIVFQPWKNTDLMPKFLVTLIYG